MSKYAELIERYHCGHGKDADWKSIVLKNEISQDDLDYFEEIINQARYGGNADYDSFPDEGGIDIAAILLAEVKRLREIKKLVC